jgi:hypothetical protein
MEFVCRKCPFGSGILKTLKEHILVVHTGMKKWKCDQCNFETGYKTSLNLHIQVHNTSEVIKCELCKHVATSKESLSMHCKDVHRELSDTKFRCNECSYTTGHRNILKVHMKRHNIAKCSDSQERGDASERRTTNVTRMSSDVATKQIVPKHEESDMRAEL